MKSGPASAGLGAWVACPAPRAWPRVRLYCVPFAGGGASTFRAWPALLPAGVEMRAIQLPGREGRLREVPYRNLASLVAELAYVLAPELELPFAIFGHSLGALIAFELARQLRRNGGPQPVHLFVSAHRAPHLQDPEEPLHALPEAQFIEKLQFRYGGIPDVIRGDPELLQLFLPMLRADMTMLETHRYAAEEPLDTPITAFGGRDDPRAPIAGLEAWRTQTVGAFRTEQLAGGHFYLNEARAPLVASIARDLVAFA